MLNILPTLTLTAAATNSSQVSLYWNGISGASGYDVYRSTISGGPYTQIASNISTADPGPGMTNAFTYSDAAGLTTGSEYFYIVVAVQSGTETIQSNENSATPDASAVPWDTGDPVQIVAAVNATALSDLQPDVDDYGNVFPQQVGPLFISAPNGVLYLGNLPNGEPPQAFPPYGKVVDNTLVGSGGIVVPIPDDNLDASSGNSSVTADDGLSFLSDSLLSPLALTPDSYPYQSTKPPTGIYRKVESAPGFAGLEAIVGLPNPDVVNLVDHPSTIAAPPGKLQPDYPTVGDIYSGGTVLSQDGSEGSELDAGLQLVPRRTDQFGVGQLTGILEWSPIVYNHYRYAPATQNDNKKHPETADKVYLDGSASYLPVGSQPGAFIYKTILQGTLNMQFLTPKFPSVRDQSVRLHFSVAQHGHGDLGFIFLSEYYPGMVPLTIKHQTEPQYLTLEYFGVIGWHKNSYKFVIKRVNSLAQTLNTPPTAANPNPVPAYPGAPQPDSPSNSAVKGYLADGSYIHASTYAMSENGSFWGLGSYTDVQLYNPTTAAWQPWLQDSTTTGKAGAYPAQSSGGAVSYGNFYNWRGPPYEISLSAK